jgi:hypothetical protein
MKPPVISLEIVLKKVTIGGTLLTLALKAMGGMKAAHPIARLFINNPETAKSWANVGEHLFRERLETWCRTGQSVFLFQEMSTLVLTVLMYIVMGSEFAEKYAAELVPLIQEHEIALQTIALKAFPRWASKVGRIMESTEKRFNELLSREAQIRLENPNQYKNNNDYFQEMVNKRDQHEGIHSKNFVK